MLNLSFPWEGGGISHRSSVLHAQIMKRQCLSQHLTLQHVWIQTNTHTQHNRQRTQMNSYSINTLSSMCNGLTVSLYSQRGTSCSFVLTIKK